MKKQNGAIVAAGHPMVADAAASVLEAGGNAFDAATAAGFAGSVAEPALTSLGGGGFLLARTSAGTSILFDFFVDTPGKGRSGPCHEPHFFPITVHFPGSDQVFNIGLGSIAVPGTLKGLLHVHQRLGSMPLREVLQPALHLARDGVELNSPQAYFLDLLRPIMLHSAKGRAMFSPNGKCLRQGDIMSNPSLADFLESLPENMGREFYEGEIARQMVRDMDQGQGLLTLEDLRTYQVIERKPLKFRYKGNKILTNPGPSFGGTLIALALKVLERLPLQGLKWGSPEHLMLLAGSMQAVDQERKKGGHALQDLDSDRPDILAAGIQRGFFRGTTHISVADAWGNVASMTNSNGEGSGYFAPSTGIMLNNMMGEDDLHPEGFHCSEPGIRISSMMSPTLVMDNRGVRLVLGSGGSKRIRTAIIQVILNYLDFDMDIKSAVNASRIHWDGDTLQVENGFSRESISEIRRLFPVNVWPETDVYFGGVHAVEPGGKGAGDPRRGGCCRNVNTPSTSRKI